VRAPSKKEAAATTVLAVELAEASAKVRVGPPIDDEEDIASPTWAGIVPLRTHALEPIADARLDESTVLPASVRALFDPTAVTP